MLSFYEFSCLLDSKKKVNENSKIDAIMAKAKALKAQKAAGQTVAKVDAPVIPPQQAVEPATQAAPAAVQLARPTPVKIGASGPDINDKAHPTFHTRDRKEGERPSRARSMLDSATEDPNQKGLVSLSRRIEKLNGLMQSAAFRYFAVQAMAEIGLQNLVPNDALVRPFIIANKGSEGPALSLADAGKGRGSDPRNEVVIDNPEDIEYIVKRVWELNGMERSGKQERNTNLSDAILDIWKKNPAQKDSVLRAMHFEKALHHPEIVGKPMSLDILATHLAKFSKTGKGLLAGSLGGPNNANTDLEATIHLIDAARHAGFGKMFNIEGDIVNDPEQAVITVVPLEQLGAVGDPLANRGTRDIASNSNDQVSNYLNQKESTGWMGVMESLEHWGF